MPFIIPSVFTAVDKFSPVVARMGTALTGFEQRLSIAQATSERSFRRHTNIFSQSANSMFDYAKGALAVGATIGGIAFTGKSIADYEDAIASFRTIVSDLNDTQFSAFEAKIASVAKTTRKSTIDVAKAFENIAGLNPEFAKTAESIGAVSAATITLAQASRMELGESAASLVGIMNQFNFEAEQSTRVINTLAAGQAVGAASIAQTAAALTKFGATAKSANVTLEQSIALVEIFAAKGFFAEDAGFKLNSGIVKLQGATLGYKSGVFNLVDALTELKAKYDALGTAAAKDAYLQKVFDITQINTGRILLENIENFKKTTDSVTGTNEAMKAAAINSNTLSNRLLELKNAWVTITTTSTVAHNGLIALKNAVGFLTNNLGTLVAIGSVWLGTMAIWKGSILAMSAAAWAASTAQAALNFVKGVGTVINGQYATSCFATIAGMNGMATASFFLELGLMGTLGTIGLVSGALFVLYSRMTDDYDASMQLRSSLDQTKDGFKQLREPITQAQIALESYNHSLDAYNERQDFIAHRMYAYQRGIAHGIAFDITHPLDVMSGGVNNPTGMMQTPDKKDFFSQIKAGSYSFKNANDTSVVINLNVDKSGNVTSTSNGATVNINNGGMPSLSSTSR